MRKKFQMPESEAQRLRRLLRHWLSQNKIRLNDRLSIKEALAMGDGSVHSLLTDGESVSPELYIRTLYRIRDRHSIGELLEREMMLELDKKANGKKVKVENDDLTQLLDENFHLLQRVRSLETCLKEIESSLKSIPCGIKTLKGGSIAG